VSTSIELEFETHIDLDFVEQGIAVHLIRLTAPLQLQTREGWTRKYKALVDTGNPISVIPNSVWSKGKINWILSHRSDLGIGGGKVSGKLGEVTLVLVNKKTASPPIKAKALLLDDDSVPFLIGFEDIMTDIKLVCDYKSKTSFFQIR